MTIVLIISLYLALLIGIGSFASKRNERSAREFYSAGQSIGPVLLFLTLFGTTMTAFALIGSSGESYHLGIGVYGLMASISGVVHSFIFISIGMPLQKLAQKYGYATQIEYFKDRFNSSKFGLLLFPILVSLLIPYLLIGVLGGGTVIEVMTRGAFPDFFSQSQGAIPKPLGGLIICLVVLTYTLLGGIRGATWANSFQTLVFILAGFCVFFVLSQKFGGFQKASENVAKYNPSKLKRKLDIKDVDRFKNSLQIWERSASSLYIYQNILSNEEKGEIKAGLTSSKSVSDMWKNFCDKVAILSPNKQLDDKEKTKAQKEYQNVKIDNFKEILKVLLPTSLLKKSFNPPVLKTHYANIIKKPKKPHGIGYVHFFTYLFIPFSVGMFPHIFAHWMTARSTKSFYLSIVAHPLFIMLVWVPCVLIGVWATSAVYNSIELQGQFIVPPWLHQNAVLPFLVKKLASPILAGLLSAGILAAVMSSLDSQFLCLSQMFSKDILAPIIGKKRFSESFHLKSGRVFIVVIVILTYLISLLKPVSVFSLGIWCFSGFGALFPIIFLSLYWKKTTKPAIYLAVISTMALWGYLFYQSDFGLRSPFLLFTSYFNTDDGVMPAAVLFLNCGIVTVLVSLLTKAPESQHLDKFFKEVD